MKNKILSKNYGGAYSNKGWVQKKPINTHSLMRSCIIHGDSGYLTVMGIT